MPKSPQVDNNPLFKPISIRNEKDKNKNKNKNVVKRTIKESTDALNLVPLPLVNSAQETQHSNDRKREQEKEQLTHLWESTLAHSIDVNFVLQKLLPATDPSRVTSWMMKAINTALYGGLSTISILSPGIAGTATQNLGTSVLSNVLSLKDSADLEKARITQTEQILLFTMVRTTADNLVSNYRNYKKFYKNRKRALDDFAALKDMAIATRQNAGISEQFTIEYTLRKQQREIEALEDDLDIYRQALIDLAGVNAVLKLDKDLIEENQEGKAIQP